MLRALSCVYMLVTSQEPRDPQFAGISDVEVVQRLDGDDPWSRSAVDELHARFRERGAQQRVPLITLLADAVEHDGNDRVVHGASTVLEGEARNRTDNRDLIGAHMRRVLLQGDPAKALVVAGYAETLVSFDQSDATREAIVAVLRNRHLLDAEHGVEGLVLSSMGAFGERGERYLIEYLPRYPSQACTALGHSGGKLAFKALKKQARKHDGFRWEATAGIGYWAERKPVGSPERLKAVRLLQSLACDRVPGVKKTALEFLARLGAEPRTCGRDDERDDDDDDDHGDDEDDRNRPRR